jgi:hypothetical protein
MQNDPREIVGVVDDLHHFGLETSPARVLQAPAASVLSRHDRRHAGPRRRAGNYAAGALGSERSTREVRSR